MYGRFDGKCCALVVLIHYVHVLAGAAHVDGRTAPSGDDVAPAAPWSEYQIPTVATAPRRLDEEGLNLQEGNWQWEEIAGAALGVVSSIICVAKFLAAREDAKRKKRKKEKEKRNRRRWWVDFAALSRLRKTQQSKEGREGGRCKSSGTRCSH
jgi:hypothetical protein